MRTWMFWIGARVTSVLIALIAPMQIEGLDRVPREGGFLLVANHCSNLDPPALGTAVGYRSGRVIHFMAKDEMRRWPIIGWLASQAGVFFVRRGEADRAAQRTAIDLLAAGRPIALFPEGSRSRDGGLRRPKPGAALIAMRAGVPVLPVGIIGSQRIFAGRFPRRAPVTIRIGEPFRLPERPNGRVEREALSAHMDRLMFAIAELLPEEQQGAYREAVTRARA